MKLLKISLVLILTTILLAGCASNPKNPAQSTPGVNTQSEEKVAYQASFEIFTDGLKRNFSNAKYHNQSPDIFITAEAPNIVNVKKTNITWGDFFNTLPMKLTKDCLTTGDGEVLCGSQTKTLKFYVNDIQTPNFLNEKIKSGDKAKVIYGN